MEFRIKLKGNAWGAAFFVLFIVFFGGFLCCAGIYDPKDPVSPTSRWIFPIIGFGMAFCGGLMLFEVFGSISRSTAEVDIDSFTEAEIHDKVEERWEKIKEQVNSQKQ